jgi:hypothetical protein
LKQERFECVPRARHVRLAECFVDHRIGASAVCVGCVVGAGHAQLAPARAWPNGALVQWVGNVPPELEHVRTRSDGVELRLGLAPAEANVIAEARPLRAERARLRLVRDMDREIELAIVGPNPREQRMPRLKNRYEHNGKALTLDEWLLEDECAENVTANTIKHRMKKGEAFGDALTRPIARGATSKKLTKANGDEQLDRVVEKHTKAALTSRADGLYRGEKRVAEHVGTIKGGKLKPKSNGTPPPVAKASSVAAELLKLAGFTVREIALPAGTMLLVEEP